MYGPDMRTRRRSAQRGLSLVEIMVGMVVALLVGLAATGSAISFTAAQRQGVGGAGALINSSTALSAIRDDVAAAGLGFFGNGQFLCTKLNLSVETTRIRNGDDFEPVEVTEEAAGDRIDVVAASDVASGANVLLEKASTGATAELRSYLPVDLGDAVLLAPPVAGVPCLVRSVTDITAATGSTPQTLTFGSTGTNAKHNKTTFTTNPTFPSGDYPDVGRVMQLTSLKWSRYRVVDGSLRLERPLEGSAALLVRNVVAFRAQYGMSAVAAGSTSLDTWETAASGSPFASMTAANLLRVRALRVGIVTRSAQPEKPNASTGNCESTQSMPTLFDRQVTADVTNWRCYRYRTSIVVVPMRNVIFGTKS
jgi:type IV pilus assembly protein PilW